MSLNTSRFEVFKSILIFNQIPKTLENSPSASNIWRPYHGYKTKIFSLVVLLLRNLVKTICFHWKNKYYFFQKSHCLYNSFFCSKQKKHNFLIIVRVNHFCLWKMTIVLTRSMRKHVTTPLLEKCEDDIHIPEMGTWESFETPETSEFDCRA